MTAKINEVNKIFNPLPFKDRIRLLYDYFKGEDILLTSSFGTKSAFLLHLIAEINPNQKIHFIDTGYHFPETLSYRKQLEQLFKLTIVDIQPDSTHHMISREEQMWCTDANLCCQVNKVLPLEAVKASHKVWISGLMGYQTKHRNNLSIFEEQKGMIKFHPLIDIDEGEFLYHMGIHKLPQHPLEEKGYGSVGCIHCTQKGKGRSGRWANNTKTECGLHLEKV